MSLDLSQQTTPLLGIAAWSGTGKTTFLEAMLPRLSERGMHVAVIKHAHHEFDVDQPGKDSHRLRQAGAAPMLVASGRRFALMMETPGRDEPDLPMLIDQVQSLNPDMILIEGFKQWPLPKLELYRPELNKPLRAWEDPWIHAVATTDEMVLPDSVTRLSLDDHDMLSEWLLTWPLRWPMCCRPRSLETSGGGDA
ncbi:molybdopterin-guanine dinucleotide biosynthesis protein B [Kushneria phosphatilytica]|uniref:Molybdopterin-guanine dinucleotide biosynthesis protein B n=1 Tax=Kushneria phosphatilytica TaxID=657387 RepID=A0A1S1NXB3_9GAMM|nr:molybdopterin-guanine dinucleotide biosynthesis protein B [Kushneria phosphatilytica]OHV12067.1 molybdopterin-guanine dinucleotide biosynthesis protein B [Kushneria phosphatilytica]QEL12804.1 molybdopterin-guanine dinucleotide biosynthesis protein B [Kushneria phosphatilytica]